MQSVAVAIDPIIVLGIASNDVQFVDFGIKIVSKGREVYKSADGKLAENVDLEAVTRVFVLINAKLKASASAASNTTALGTFASNARGL